MYTKAFIFSLFVQRGCKVLRYRTTLLLEVVASICEILHRNLLNHFILSLVRKWGSRLLAHRLLGHW